MNYRSISPQDPFNGRGQPLFGAPAATVLQRLGAWLGQVLAKVPPSEPQRP